MTLSTDVIKSTEFKSKLADYLSENAELVQSKKRNYTRQLLDGFVEREPQYSGLQPLQFYQQMKSWEAKGESYVGSGTCTPAIAKFEERMAKVKVFRDGLPASKYRTTMDEYKLFLTTLSDEEVAHFSYSTYNKIKKRLSIRTSDNQVESE